MEMINLNTNYLPLAGDAKKAKGLSCIAPNADDKKKIEVAKDFEAIFIRQLFSQMKNTIGESGFLQDGSSKQIQDMFWSFLGDEVSEQGGLGMWKNIYESIDIENGKSESAEILDTEA